MSEKLKSLLNPLKPSKNRIINFLIYLVLGIIADLALEAVVLWTSNGKGWGSLEVGFPFYIGHDITSIAYDDLILLAVSLVLVFSKQVWKGMAFFIGFYMSSCGDFYGKFGFPKPEG